jgi:cobalamin biosynthesis Mg chelatase CobN
MAQDPKLLEAQRKLQQLQDAYTISTNKHEEEEAAQYSRLVALNQEAATMVTVVRSALALAGEALVAARDAIPEPPAIPVVAKATSDAASAAAQAAQAAAAAAAAAAQAAAQVPTGGAVKAA